MKSWDMSRCARRQGSHEATATPFARSLRSAAAATFLGAALLSASTFVLAGIPGIQASVTSLVPATGGARVISYSTGDSTYQSAYEVRIANVTSSNINSIFFTVATSVVDKVSGLPNAMSAPFIVPVPGCTASLTNTRLDCEFGPLPAGSAPIVFTLLVTSPTVSGTAPDSNLRAGWTIQSGQGQANPSNLVYDLSEVVTLKVGSAKDGVQSYVLADGILSVADASAANAATKVKTPKPVTIGVKQIVPGGSCSPQNKKCFESTITIVNDAGAEVEFTQSDPLQIDLFRPFDSLKKNARFANAQLLYKSGAGAWVPIQTCAVDPTTSAYVIPTSYPFRCITPQVLPYAASGATGVDASGNWYFHILGLFNGVIDW